MADSRGVLRKLPNSTLSFAISALSRENNVEQLRVEAVISEARGSLLQMKEAPSPLVKAAETGPDMLDQAVAGVQSFSDTWNSVISKLELFAQLTDAIAEVWFFNINNSKYSPFIPKIHPYVKTACFVLSARLEDAK